MAIEYNEKLIAFKIGNPKKLIGKNGEWLNKNIPVPTEKDYEIWQVEYDAAQVQKSWGRIRARRTRLLVDSDVKVLPDFPHESNIVRESWLKYRQALRDLPSMFKNPEDVIFPNDPDYVDPITENNDA